MDCFIDSGIERGGRRYRAERGPKGLGGRRRRWKFMREPSRSRGCRNPGMASIRLELLKGYRRWRRLQVTGGGTKLGWPIVTVFLLYIPLTNPALFTMLYFPSFIAKKFPRIVGKSVSLKTLNLWSHLFNFGSSLLPKITCESLSKIFGS